MNKYKFKVLQKMKLNKSINFDYKYVFSPFHQRLMLSLALSGKHNFSIENICILFERSSVHRGQD